MVCLRYRDHPWVVVGRTRAPSGQQKPSDAGPSVGKNEAGDSGPSRQPRFWLSEGGAKEVLVFRRFSFVGVSTPPAHGGSWKYKKTWLFFLRREEGRLQAMHGRQWNSGRCCAWTAWALVLLCSGSASASEGLSRGRRQTPARHFGFWPGPNQAATTRMSGQEGPARSQPIAGCGRAGVYGSPGVAARGNRVPYSLDAPSPTICPPWRSARRRSRHTDSCRQSPGPRSDPSPTSCLRC